MAASIGTPLVSEVIGSVRLLVVPVTFDSSYPTGGEIVDFTSTGTLTTVLSVSIAPYTGGGISAHYVPTNHTTGKILCNYQDGTTEFGQVSSTDDLSAETVLCTVIGR
jgi:hypothetical protein